MLRDILSGVNEAALVSLTSASQVLLYVNDAFCRLLGYRREELLGNTQDILDSGYHSDPFLADQQNTLNAGEIWRGDIRYRAKNGMLLWLDTTVVPILKPNGSPSHFVWVRKDVTERKQLEGELRLLTSDLEDRVALRTRQLEQANQDLQVSLKDLRESEALRNTFVATITHDLRTPLLAQQRILELFDYQKGNLPENMLALADRLISSNSDVLNMVNTLLEVYQLDTGKFPARFRHLPLCGLIEDCFLKLRPLADQRHIALVCDCRDELPNIYADRQLITRVFNNLLGNAIEHLRDGDRITVSARIEQDQLMVRVQDNGPGIAAEILPHLFERYFISDYHRKKIGSGLGLYICRSLMELHGGQITVESSPTRGTCFTLTFPLSSTHQPAQSLTNRHAVLSVRVPKLFDVLPAAIPRNDCHDD